MVEEIKETYKARNDSGPDEFINYEKRSSNIMRPKFSRENKKKSEAF